MTNDYATFLETIHESFVDAIEEADYPKAQEICTFLRSRDFVEGAQTLEQTLADTPISKFAIL